MEKWLKSTVTNIAVHGLHKASGLHYKYYEKLMTPSFPYNLSLYREEFKGKFVPVVNKTLCHEDIWKSEGIGLYILKLPLDGCKRPASRPDSFTPRK
jgi:hypothetical protein